MNVDLEDGTVTEQPADDIRSSLAAALAESEGTAPDPAAQAPAAPDAGDNTDSADGRVRGPDGKFVKKDEAAPAAKPAAGKPDTAAVPDPNAPAAPVADSKDPPTHWSQADKDKFKSQAPETQAFILDRFKAMEGDYTRKTQAIANLKNEYGPVDEMFAPHKDVLRQKGFTPRSLIEAWANVETKLAAGPDSAIDVIKGLVSGYSIPVEKIAAALGLSRGSAPAPQPNQQQPGQQPTAVENGQQVALPPEVVREIQQLREQVGSFGQKFQTIEQRDEAQRRAVAFQQEQAVENQVNEFRNSVDDKGSLLHPHMAEVEGLMTSLAQAALASKQPVPSLKELYETAVYAHPSTREKVLTAQRQQEEAKRADEARAKAASARKAGSSVTGAPGPGQAPNGKSNTELSLREQLEAAADEAA
jgi:hypothetical protein